MMFEWTTHHEHSDLRTLTGSSDPLILVKWEVLNQRANPLPECGYFANTEEGNFDRMVYQLPNYSTWTFEQRLQYYRNGHLGTELAKILKEYLFQNHQLDDYDHKSHIYVEEYRDFVCELFAYTTPKFKVKYGIDFRNICMIADFESIAMLHMFDNPEYGTGIRRKFLGKLANIQVIYECGIRTEDMVLGKNDYTHALSCFLERIRASGQVMNVRVLSTHQDGILTMIQNDFRDTCFRTDCMVRQAFRAKLFGKYQKLDPLRPYGQG
jgi:hypothetical protein